MSLKAFHVVFIVVCTLLAVGTGVWGFRDYQATHAAESMAMAVGSLVGLVALIAYGVWFLRKLKNVSYL